jgi:hypothetical protein
MEQHDEMLWAIAKKRAGFRKQLISYILVSSFMWGIWFMSGNKVNLHSSFPWPAWVMFWWGIGLAFSFANAYLLNTGGAVEQEYQKLKNQQ